MVLFTKEEMKNYQFQPNSLSPECFKCGLYRHVNSPKMQVTGKGKKKILILAEAPGRNEDLYNIQLCGDAGKFYEKKLKKVGIDMREDCWLLNAVNCRPHGENKNRAPTKEEIEFCRPMVENVINELKPDFIWALGKAALLSLFGRDFKNIKMERFRRMCIPDQKFGSYIIPLYHPSFVKRGEGKDENLQAIFMHDLRYAVTCLNKKPSFSINLRALDVQVLRDYKDIIDLLEDTLDQKPPEFVFDYETTGLYPFIPGHKIVSMSFSVHPDQAFSFPYDHTNIFSEKQKASIRERWLAILQDRDILKIAHNAQFEDLWTNRILKGEIVDWFWCTQLAQRSFDNRRAGSGLKYLIYRYFGIRPYDKDISVYLKGDPFNKIEKAPLFDLLNYGGRDSLFTFWLYELQEKNRFLQEKPFGRELLTEAGFHFSKMTQTGICVDEEYFWKEIEKESKHEKELTEKMLQHKLSKAFYDKYKRLPSFTSNPDVGKLLYEIGGYPVIYTDEEETTYSVDKAALDKIDNELTKDLLALRKTKKGTSTYMEGFLKVTSNGKLNPSYTHNVTVTLRSSSNHPNFQNIPNRDKEMMQRIRGGLKPMKGYKLLEFDYSGIEVRTSYFYHKDENMRTYILDEGTDMHRDTAGDIWFLDKENITKGIRHSGKNGWVFPEFYGSFYKACAENLWYNFMDTPEMNLPDGTPLREHMKKQGIKTYKQFENHCKEVERIFWEERFFHYAEWRKEVNKQYRRDGYIKTLTGFILSTYMIEREVTNYPIQGTAHHLLIWTLNRLMQEQNKRRWKTRFCGNIHDSGVAHLWPAEEEEVVRTIIDIGGKEIRQRFDWVTLPLPIDIEVTKVDEPWSKKKKLRRENG